MPFVKNQSDGGITLNWLAAERGAPGGVVERILHIEPGQVGEIDEVGLIAVRQNPSVRRQLHSGDLRLVEQPL